ncbi:IS3 family transposase [Paraburkholderia mimosarum]|uniref:IS3 family transposase n=2 Tax=Paraburkholderia mimosarum TaxID=312026 RepID=UPI001591607D|nr:IS3 family transposase [Paraburkholderia mimosarum]
MAKYDKRFKLKLINTYLRGGVGLPVLAARHGIDYSMLRRWVDAYRLHGSAALCRKHSRYDVHFRLKVLRHMSRDGVSLREVTALYDIRDPGKVSQWARLYDEGGIDALMPRRRGRPQKMPETRPNLPVEMKAAADTRSREELLKEIVYLRAEVAYPKKARCAVKGRKPDSAKEKTQIVNGLRTRYPLAALLKIAGLARSTFYYQLRALEAGERHVELKATIRAVYEHHKGRYGYRRITAAIRNAGRMVNHKTVQRLMGELQLKSLVRPKRYRSWRGEVGRVAPNLLDREFEARRPNQKWVTDVTEFNVKGEKLYLSPVMDLYNGEIVAWQTARRPCFELVSNMLKKAVTQLGTRDKPLLHSDQGWQYQMSAWRRLLSANRLRQSMSRRGNCLDNAAMESFFATLKSEFFRLNRFDSIEQLQAGLRRYIHYYNHERIKLKLNGLSPVQYRTQLLAA